MNTDWRWCYENPHAAAVVIDRLRKLEFWSVLGSSTIRNYGHLEPQEALEAMIQDAVADRTAELEQQLSRYQGGVEVEGMAVKYANVFPAKFISCNFPDELIGQRVRVLVLPEERIVATNNTMEVE